MIFVKGSTMEVRQGSKYASNLPQMIPFWEKFLFPFPAKIILILKALNLNPLIPGDH